MLLHWVAAGILSETEGLEGSTFSVLFYSAPFTGAVNLIVKMCTGILGSTVISDNDKSFIGCLFVSCLNDCTFPASARILAFGHTGSFSVQHKNQLFCGNTCLVFVVRCVRGATCS